MATTEARIEAIEDMQVGTRFWLCRRRRGVLGSRDVIAMMTSEPTEPHPTYGSVTFDAVEWELARNGDVTSTHYGVTICCLPSNRYEVIE